MIKNRKFNKMEREFLEKELGLLVVATIRMEAELQAVIQSQE